MESAKAKLQEIVGRNDTPVIQVGNNRIWWAPITTSIWATECNLPSSLVAGDLCIDYCIRLQIDEAVGGRINRKRRCCFTRPIEKETKKKKAHKLDYWWSSWWNVRPQWIVHVAEARETGGVASCSASDIYRSPLALHRYPHISMPFLIFFPIGLNRFVGPSTLLRNCLTGIRPR